MEMDSSFWVAKASLQDPGTTNVKLDPPGTSQDQA